MLYFITENEYFTFFFKNWSLLNQIVRLAAKINQVTEPWDQQK